MHAARARHAPSSHAGMHVPDAQHRYAAKLEAANAALAASHHEASELRAQNEAVRDQNEQLRSHCEELRGMVVQMDLQLRSNAHDMQLRAAMPLAGGFVEPPPFVAP